MLFPYREIIEENHIKQLKETHMMQIIFENHCIYKNDYHSYSKHLN